jgi:hypothetical protein
VEKFVVILTLVCGLAFAQDAPPVEPQEPIIIDVDPRCKNAVIWGISLVVKKQNGITHDQAKKQLGDDYMVGSLGNPHPEVLAYMFDIVDLVYKNNTTTAPEITQTSIDINDLCVIFLDAPRIEPKPLPIKT